MCLACGDVDKGQKMQQALEECNGILKPYMTLSQLIDDLSRESRKCGKTIFRIFKDILVNPPKEPVVKNGQLTINFV